MAKKTIEKPENDEQLTEFKQLFDKLYPGSEIRWKNTGESKPYVEREKGGKYIVLIDPTVIDEKSTDLILAKTISSIELLQTEANLAMDDEAQEDVDKYKNRCKNKALKLFYQTVYQSVGLHKNSLKMPVLRDKLAEIGFSNLLSLKVKPDNVPLHIQFLFALMGVNKNIDNDVLNTISELRAAGYLGRIYHNETPEAERLKIINNDIFPLYEYYLRMDLKLWKKKLVDDEEEIQKDTKEKVDEAAGEDAQNEKSDDGQDEGEGQPGGEESADGSEEEDGEDQEDSQQGQGGGGGGGQPGEGGQSSTDESGEDQTPDYNEGYDTPEGGSFEKDPTGKGYKLEIFPPLHGYYAIDRKNYFDGSKLKWFHTAKSTQYTKNPQFQGKKYTISGILATKGGGNVKAIPVPNTYALDLKSLQFKGDRPKITRDENGNFFFEIHKRCEFSIDFYQEAAPLVSPPTKQDTQLIYQGRLSIATEDIAAKIISLANNSVKQAEAVRDYIRKNHKYPSGKGEKSTLNAAKDTQLKLRKSSDASNYVQNLDASKDLECYSANTLFVAILRKLGIPSRLVTGHHVLNENKQGNSVINSANGHGWCEFWDGKRWIRIDATPDAEKNEEDEKDEEKKEDKKDEKKEDKKEDKKKDEKEKPRPEDASDGGIDTDDSGSDSKDKGEDKKEKDKKEGEKGDGEEGSDKGNEEGEGEGEGEDSDGESEGGDGKSSEKGGKSGGKQKKSGEAKIDDFDPEEEFKKMYKELEDSMSDTPDEDAVRDAVEQMEQEKIEMEEALNRDPIEETIEQKFPNMDENERKEMTNFVKGFIEAAKKISQIKNPDADTDPENPFLIDALRSILDRVISRSIKEEIVPRYPVSDGEVLIDPVQLYFDERQGLGAESRVWQRSEKSEREELKIVKVRRRKILDGSGSMCDAGKINLQQRIEVLENIVIAEKQRELDTLSNSLSRDLRMETETWQFGFRDPQTGKDYRRLKALSPEMDVLDQAVTWYCSGQASGGTNDYDPLESIYDELAQEFQDEQKANPDKATVFERIRAGFCIRELRALEELKEKDIKDLSTEEKIYLNNLVANEQNFQKALDDLTTKYGEDIEPIVEVVEVSTDGGSNSAARVQTVIKKLRGIGVIVIAYGLGNDGRAVEGTYANPYNPMEGGIFCQNLLDYPRKKMDAWARILDKV